MSHVLEIEKLTKTYKDKNVLDKVSFSLDENKIYGLLGRNGAGKTTIMHIITAQRFPTSGSVKIFGEGPYENNHVLSKVCFIKESQHYPDYFKVSDVLATAASIYPNWDAAFSRRLVSDFQLPQKQLMKKLSRGMLSSVGIVVGLASRAPLTIFDEPYLGLDSVARSIFYDRLLEDYAEYPRTVVLSTHLIDEVSQLLEHVLLIDQGKLVLNEEIESLRGQVYTIMGSEAVIKKYIKGKEVLRSEHLGDTVSATIYDKKMRASREMIAQLGLEYIPVSIQQAVTYLTTKAIPEGEK